MNIVKEFVTYLQSLLINLNKIVGHTCKDNNKKKHK